MADSLVNRISQRNRNRKRAPRQCAQSFRRERKPIEIVVNDCMGLLELWYSRRRWFELKPGTAKCDRNEFVIDLLALRPHANGMAKWQPKPNRICCHYPRNGRPIQRRVFHSNICIAFEYHLCWKFQAETWGQCWQCTSEFVWNVLPVHLMLKRTPSGHRISTWAELINPLLCIPYNGYRHSP